MHKLGGSHSSNLYGAVKRDIVLLTNLQTRWNPNIKNGNVDDCNENSRTDHDGTGSSSVGYDDANSVDDDLKQQLNLDAPKEDYTMSDYWNPGNLWSGSSAMRLTD